MRFTVEEKQFSLNGWLWVSKRHGAKGLLKMFSDRRRSRDGQNSPINKISARSLTLSTFAVMWAVGDWHCTTEGKCGLIPKHVHYQLLLQFVIFISFLMSSCLLGLSQLANNNNNNNTNNNNNNKIIIIIIIDFRTVCHWIFGYLECSGAIELTQVGDDDQRRSTLKIYDLFSQVITDAL